MCIRKKKNRMQSGKITSSSQEYTIIVTHVSIINELERSILLCLLVELERNDGKMIQFPL